MAIRVTQRNMYGSMINNMQNSLAAYMESFMQGSTQKRINRPSDDPAGAFRVLTARNQIQNTDQYKTNVETAKGWLQLADNVVATQTSNVLTQLKELAEQASTDTYTAEQRKIMADEARALFGSLLNLGNTEFDGKSIFGGHKYDINAFEESLAVTSWDENWAEAANEGAFSIEGSSKSTIMVQFTSDGTVVHRRYLIWSTISTSHTADDITVVSDNGESLSPNSAPVVIAPAVYAGGIPSPMDTPMRATPAVEIVPHEVPVIMDMSAPMRHVTTRNIPGLMNCIP